jgi:hypothetical protein
MNFTAKELAQILAILDAKTNSFVSLVRIAGLRPGHDFRGANLRGVNFRTDDLTGFDFSGADLIGADVSMAKGVDGATWVNVKTNNTTRGRERLVGKQANSRDVETNPVPKRTSIHEKPLESVAQQPESKLSNPAVVAPQRPPSRKSLKSIFRTSTRPTPAVPIHQSVKHDYIICLEDGQKVVQLKHHLRAKFRMTPRQYRAKWDLPDDYPMEPPSNDERRSGTKTSNKQKTTGRNWRSQR